MHISSGGPIRSPEYYNPTTKPPSLGLCCCSCSQSWSPDVSPPMMPCPSALVGPLKTWVDSGVLPTSWADNGGWKGLAGEYLVCISGPIHQIEMLSKHHQARITFERPNWGLRDHAPCSSVAVRCLLKIIPVSIHILINKNHPWSQVQRHSNFPVGFLPPPPTNENAQKGISQGFPFACFRKPTGKLEEWCTSSNKLSYQDDLCPPNAGRPIR